jgi:hypothetical protein
MDTGNEACFVEFPKMARLSRECVITEKIDGTNAQVNIVPSALMPALFDGAVTLACLDDMVLMAGSRTRWITLKDDNYGFARWAQEHALELFGLGPGRHFGEWWGAGIQRNYGMKEKRFSLFNTIRWADRHNYPNNGEGVVFSDKRGFAPACCYMVPVMYHGIFHTEDVVSCLEDLSKHGSMAAPGFVDPEGVVTYHTAGNVGFKKTLKNDEVPKSLVDKRK